jgi:hypothetical protein
MEAMHARLVPMALAVEADFGWEDETAGKLSTAMGSLLDAAFDLRLKSGMTWVEAQQAGRYPVRREGDR